FLRGEPAQLWMRDVGGKERPVTELATGVQSFAWSPDGRRIAVVTPLTSSEPADREKASETIVEVHRRSPPPGRALLVIDLATGGAEEVARSEPGVNWRMVVWSPEGRRLVLWEDSLGRDLEEADRPVVLDLETGRMHCPTGRSRRQGNQPCWSPDG